jgi:hypothetical protein
MATESRGAHHLKVDRGRRNLRPTGLTVADTGARDKGPQRLGAESLPARNVSGSSKMAEPRWSISCGGHGNLSLASRFRHRLGPESSHQWQQIRAQILSNVGVVYRMQSG